MSIFQYESNKHCNKMQNQTMPHKTANNTMLHSDGEIKKKKKLKKKLDIYGNHLFRLKEKGEKMDMILGKKKT